MESLSNEPEAPPRFKVPKTVPPADDTAKQKQSKGVDQVSDTGTVSTGPCVFQTGETEATSRDSLNDRAQQVIDKLNEKRKKDTTLLAEFKKSLEDQAASAYSTVEQGMVEMYERNSKVVQEKVQELFAILDRIAKQEEEMHRFRSALGMLYSDVREP